MNPLSKCCDVSTSWAENVWRDDEYWGVYICDGCGHDCWFTMTEVEEIIRVSQYGKNK